jgi:hypothetical protein
VRRRMIGEVVAPNQVAPAVAFDSLTNSFARVLGPLAGGAAYQTLGLGGAYFLSAALYLAPVLAVSGLDFRQEPRKLRFGRIAIDIAEAVAVARANPAILAVVLVSIIMNMFAFSYSALIGVRRRQSFAYSGRSLRWISPAGTPAIFARAGTDPDLGYGPAKSANVSRAGCMPSKLGEGTPSSAGFNAPTVELASHPILERNICVRRNRS